MHEFAQNPLLKACRLISRQAVPPTRII